MPRVACNIPGSSTQHHPMSANRACLAKEQDKTPAGTFAPTATPRRACRFKANRKPLEPQTRQAANARQELTRLAVGQVFDRGADRAARLGELLAVERVFFSAAVDVHCSTEAAQHRPQCTDKKTITERLRRGFCRSSGWACARVVGERAMLASPRAPSTSNNYVKPTT